MSDDARKQVSDVFNAALGKPATTGGNGHSAEVTDEVTKKTPRAAKKSR